jgi:hypothetical protein
VEPGGAVFIPEEKRSGCAKKFFGKIYAWYQPDIYITFFAWDDYTGI